MMGVDLYIGEAVLSSPTDCLKYPDESHKIEVRVLELPDGSNHWKFTYSGFRDFLLNAGLYDLMWADGTAIMSDHPGCDLITPEMLSRFQQAKKCLEGQDPALKLRSHIEAINWFVSQSERALGACKIPAIMNR